MCNKFMEKRTHFRRGAIHALGMPLNSEGERMSGKFDCLNDAVRGPGADTDVSPGCFDRLMVETVHINARAYKLFEL